LAEKRTFAADTMGDGYAQIVLKNPSADESG
jgi:hypothetical protein